MRALSKQEKRTLGIGAAILLIYFVGFGGMQAWRFLAKRHSDYQQLVQDAEKLRGEVKDYQGRADQLKMLMETNHIDPAKLTKASVVAQASSAIQKAALSGGMQVGPVRESGARPSSKELASMQLEGSGPVPAVMGFLSRLESIGYPLIIDSLQLTPDQRPGQVKLSLTLVILDYEQWKKEGAPNV
jgi:hypothetical protein